MPFLREIDTTWFLANPDEMTNKSKKVCKLNHKLFSCAIRYCFWSFLKVWLESALQDWSGSDYKNWISSINIPLILSIDWRWTKQALSHLPTVNWSKRRVQAQGWPSIEDSWCTHWRSIVVTTIFIKGIDTERAKWVHIYIKIVRLHLLLRKIPTFHFLRE